MCGRFTLTVDLATVAESYGVVPTVEQLEMHLPRYNVAPGDACWLVREREGQRQLKRGLWGLVNHWSKDRAVGYRQINARAETLPERPAFREAYRSRRCVVPADGFYEWRGPRTEREPLWFHPPDGSLLSLAGLYESWRDPARDLWMRTFTVVTTDPNELVRPVHDRMPAILTGEAVGAWLRGDTSQGLLVPAAEGLLVASPASPRVNRVEHDDPDLLDPDDPRVPKQLGLFS